MGEQDEMSGAGPSSYRGTIAVDMDDVLAQTNATIVEMHNDMYRVQPPLTLDDFKHYLYWDNRGWKGTWETAELCDAGLYQRSAPVPGAKEGLMRLKEMGYQLIIITARGEKSREISEDWIAEYLPDRAFVHLMPTHEEEEGHVAKRAVVSHKKRTKAEICHETGAFLLIDDSSENILSASLADPPVKCLLFGDYGWNAVLRPTGEPIHPDDREVEQGGLTYVEKAERGLTEESEKRREKDIEKGWLPGGVWRVKDWGEVVDWVKRWEEK